MTFCLKEKCGEISYFISRNTGRRVRDEPPTAICHTWKELVISGIVDWSSQAYYFFRFEQAQAESSI